MGDRDRQGPWVSLKFLSEIRNQKLQSVKNSYREILGSDFAVRHDSVGRVFIHAPTYFTAVAEQKARSEGSTVDANRLSAEEASNAALLKMARAGAQGEARARRTLDLLAPFDPRLSAEAGADDGDGETAPA